MMPTPRVRFNKKVYNMSKIYNIRLYDPLCQNMAKLNAQAYVGEIYHEILNNEFLRLELPQSFDY